MAKADYLISLIKTHYEGDHERFTTVALQAAAYEAKLGHIVIAEEIRNLVDKTKTTKFKSKTFSPDLQGLILESPTSFRRSDLIVSKSTQGKIDRIISEFVQRDKLRRHDLRNRRKILLSGPPGTGKTMTASVIAHELGLPLFTVLIDKLVTNFMGETSAKLRQIFDLIQERVGVYLFDEFDAIGGERSRENDVGEMRRVLNSFLQFIERDNSESLVIAITNNKRLLDAALFRRFDDVITYELPTEEEKLALLQHRLGPYAKGLNLKKLLPNINGLSHAEISLACLDAIKTTVLDDKEKMTNALISKAIKERNLAYHAH